MQTPAATPCCFGLVRVAAFLGLAVALLPDRGLTQQPAPVSPTVPYPNVTIRGPHLRPNHAGVSVTAQPGGANDAGPGKGADDAPDASVPELTLGECIAVAVDRQPSLRAVRASQDATGIGQQALNNIGRLGQLLRPDLPIRKEQSARGVIATAADVQKLHNEVVYDVTRMYYSAVYARQQEQLAADVEAQIDLFVKVARDLLNSANPGTMNKAKFDQMLIGQAEVRMLHATARTGIKSADAGLREAMGVAGCDFPFRVKDKELPLMAQNVPLTEEMVVELALCRRPELALAAAGADAFRLEVYAQGELRGKRSVPTLASGSDIHSRLLPPGSRDPGQDYRPEPIPPEMPPILVGSKEFRVARAKAYSERADAVYEKARGLMILEAQSTYYKFEFAANRVQIAKQGFDAARDLMDRTREGFDNPNAEKDRLMLAYGQAAQASSKYITAVFDYLVALAFLERVTAGGVKPAFPGR